MSATSGSENSVTIRQLDHSDQQVIDQMFPLLQQLTTTVQPESIAMALDHSGTMVFVATKQSTLVGTGSLCWTACLTGVRVHIEDIVIDRAHRNQGIATRLLTALVDAAQHQLHAKSIDLTSRPDRVAANALYQKLGFVPRDTNVYRYQPTSPQ
ncbi:acyl-CoA N-acyltransferase [Hesseltinella vesiculosa]|uniref:Acyl-CoA N-acyltransferase n=1 Tax=Hesseltinella vesiculosa TaxID=101127 RepID=A0A1X2GBX6_9FUNG|nr:acyl-CoA N-acyltransferase [Hesseltinella vesiculosa]